MPSACTYLPPRKKTCTHPCKLVTRKNKPQCRTKYLRKGKKRNGKKGKETMKRRTRGKKLGKALETTETIQEEPSSTEESTTIPDETVETPPSTETSEGMDPLKSMVDIFSKKVSFMQKPV